MQHAIVPAASPYTVASLTEKHINDDKRLASICTECLVDLQYINARAEYAYEFVVMLETILTDKETDNNQTPVYALVSAIYAHIDQIRSQIQNTVDKIYSVEKEKAIAS